MAFSIKLDKHIYPMNVISQGINDYREVAKIQIQDENDKYILCQVDCKDSEFEEIKKEFGNYLIALINIGVR